jgi:hypothetical protein
VFVEDNTEVLEHFAPVFVEDNTEVLEVSSHCPGPLFSHNKASVFNLIQPHLVAYTTTYGKEGIRASVS